MFEVSINAKMPEWLEKNVLIVDDQHRSHQSLRALIATWLAIRAIREAANSAAVLRMAGDFRPDLVPIDGRMAAVLGLDIAQRIM